jgi:hypothetical protein
MVVYSTELGIRLSFVKLQNFGGRGGGLGTPLPYSPPEVFSSDVNRELSDHLVSASSGG